MSGAAQPRVAVTRRLPAAVEARMSTLFDTRLNAADQPMTADEIVAAAADAQVLVSSITDQSIRR